MMEHHVYFAIVGFDHDPARLDVLLGQGADDYWREGDTYSDAFPDAQRRENRWILSSQLDERASHRDHFEKLLLKLQRLAPQLKNLPGDYRYGIGVSHYFFMDDPAFYLPDDIIEGFNALGFDVTFDQLGIDNGPGN
ncbi:MAG: DUF4279 domain-containing protein [Pseudomonadales bacterium]|nr:DUF4279 domain-containing protein [Alcanivorax profundi]MCG8439271.1 DUF4279 domain-containing protein [Pseudomonadales bacterium]MEE2871247.1 DUF4279 domain-containing protein [Pseudomonadota bacterium]|tara:strand:- start:3154 stop:3564 length:411 start_codon:yes stop_codon:yes gene_type:complete